MGAGQARPQAHSSRRIPHAFVVAPSMTVFSLIPLWHDEARVVGARSPGLAAKRLGHDKIGRQQGRIGMDQPV
jgi:hypothetical protein